MKRLEYLTRIFFSLFALLVLVISSYGHAGARDLYLPDPPTDQVVVKLKPGVACLAGGQFPWIIASDL